MGDQKIRSVTPLDIVREICDSIESIDQEYAKLKSAMATVIGVDAVRSLSIVEVMDAAMDCFKPVTDGMEENRIKDTEVSQ